MHTRLSRRTFLKAAGVCLGLPLLEAMSPRGLWAADAAQSPRRFVGIMTNQGILPQFFFPAQAGKDYESTPYLDLLKDHRNDMTVFSGVSLPGVDGGHAAERAFLTGTPHPGRGSFRNGISLDQLAAESIGGDSRFPSLSLMVGSDSLSLSWTRNGSMIPPERSPLKLYQKLFVEDSKDGKAAAHQRLKEDRSLLDALIEQTKKLEKSVSAVDRERLDQYYTAVRELEKRLAKSENWVDVPKPKVEMKQPEEIKDTNDLVANSRVMFDLARLALETESTRVITVCVSLASVTPRQIPGVHTNTHELTHHGNREEKISELRKIEEAQLMVLSDFLTKLRGARENDQSLFDRTTVLYGTNMGSANSHSNDNLPVLLAGGGFKHAGHLAFDRKNNQPLSNLYVSILQRLGIETDKFSTSTGPQKGLDLA
jgi:hypothetical protein